MKYPRPLAEKGSLRSHDAAAHRRQYRPVTIWAPPDQILDPPLELDSSRYVSFFIGNSKLYRRSLNYSHGQSNYIMYNINDVMRSE